jgi:hypothetical protein
METDITPYIRFRLGNIDSYQGTPSSSDRDDFAKVPIIRIWGAADKTGQKVDLCYSLLTHLDMLSCSWNLPILLYRIHWKPDP